MPLTETTPKALISVCGKPLVERSLQFLSDQGISVVGVNAHYHADQIAAFQRRSPHPFTLFHEENKIRGTGGGLHFAREFLGADEAFFVCNVDIVYAVTLQPLLDRFRQTDWDAGLITVPQTQEGTIYYDPFSHAYRGVPADTARSPSMAAGAFIGAALYRRSFLDLLNSDDFSVVPVWKRAVCEGRRIGVLETDGFWRDIGTPSALAAIHFDCLDGSAPLDIGPGLIVDHQAPCCYPSSLPEHLREAAGPYAWVESDRIGKDSRISRSIVFKGGEIAPGRSIEGMIVAPDCEVGFAT
jgi:NDP-sugar pyrophosphorylase family protein